MYSPDSENDRGAARCVIGGIFNPPNRLVRPLVGYRRLVLIGGNVESGEIEGVCINLRYICMGSNFRARPDLILFATLAYPPDPNFCLRRGVGSVPIPAIPRPTITRRRRRDAAGFLPPCGARHPLKARRTNPAPAPTAAGKSARPVYAARPPLF